MYITNKNYMLPLLSIRNSCLAILSVILLCACSPQQNVQVDAIDQQPTDVSNESDKSLTQSDKGKYQAGLKAIAEANYSKAKRVFSDFIRNKPTLAGPYSNLALVYFKENDLDNALKFVNKAIQLNDKQAAAYNLRAQIYIRNSKIHQAKDDYIKAVTINPKYANAQYNLALLYDIYLQEVALAIKHYEVYMKLLDKPDQQTKDWIEQLKGSMKNG